MSNSETAQIVLYRRDDGAPALAVQLESDTVWLSTQQIAELFGASRPTIVEHVQNVYAEGELSEEATCRKSRQVRMEGTRRVNRTVHLYNLDLIISVGYRVKSKVATQFPAGTWPTSIPA